MNKINENNIELLCKHIIDAKYLVAFTEAGASTDSGIPDLDAINQILKNDGLFSYSYSHLGIMGLLSADFALNNPREFYRLYRKTFFHPKAQPNTAHQVLARLEHKKILKSLVTMNIDTLHQQAGSQKLIEYWGNIRLNLCAYCKKQYDWDLTAYNQNEVPICSECKIPIIPEFVWRNLASYPKALQEGERQIEKADVLIILGTKRSPESFQTAGLKFVINNCTASSYLKNVINITATATEVFRLVNQKLCKYI